MKITPARRRQVNKTSTWRITCNPAASSPSPSPPPPPPPPFRSCCLSFSISSFSSRMTFSFTSSLHLIEFWMLLARCAYLSQFVVHVFQGLCVSHIADHLRRVYLFGVVVSTANQRNRVLRRHSAVLRTKENRVHSLTSEMAGIMIMSRYVCQTTQEEMRMVSITYSRGRLSRYKACAAVVIVAKCCAQESLCSGEHPHPHI